MSASVVNIPNDNYIIKVQPGGTITLDTGPVQGNVIFTGNFTVGGQQTIVNSTNLDVQDNIITVNHGETGAGVTLNQSGLQMIAHSARFLSNHPRSRTEIGLTAQVLKGYKLLPKAVKA